MSTHREVLSWEGFGLAARELATDVLRAGRPDAILAIARGGLPVAGALAYALNVKALSLINVELYTGVDARLDAPLVLPPALELGHLTGASLVIADDVADTGTTLDLVRRLCADRVGEVRTAVLYRKPQSIASCDHVWRETDQWIEFPWSTLPPVTLTA